MILPLLAMLLVVLIQGALLGVELVTAQGLAREAARTAVVDDDAAVRSAVKAAAGDRKVEVDIDPAAGERAVGDLVTVELRLRSHALAELVEPVWLPAKAVMRVEAVQ